MNSTEALVAAALADLRADLEREARAASGALTDEDLDAIAEPTPGTPSGVRY